ncbi:MAG: amidase [Vicinamibacterales bacterium]
MSHRLFFVVALTALTAIPQAQSPSRFELDEMTLTQLQDAMASGRYTSRRLVDLYTRRINEIDRNGPALRSVIVLNPDATSIADALDAERKSRGARGPLHGIPILIKDNIDTADRMPTTAGSLALEGSMAARDAFVVERLRAAGAVILGKTNLSEWANFRSTKSASGWSAIGGQTKNPYVLDRNACGSSSGTAVAVAANLAAAGVGTETDGSVVCPASVNGLVGLKPTVGLVSRSGIIPISHTQDTAGPMARTVADAAALLSGMIGRDPADAAMTRGRSSSDADVRVILDRGALKGARIGVARKRYFGYSPATDRVVDTAIAAMKEQGAVIIDPANIPSAGQFEDCEFEILLFEFKANLNAYLKRLGPSARVHSLADVIAFNEREKDREMPFFGQEIFEMAQKKGPLTSPAYRKAMATCRTRSRTQGIDAALAAHRLDAIVAPTGGPAWPIDPVNGDHYLGSSSTPAAVAGYPSVTVPAGFVHGLPVGISFISRPWTDLKLLSMAYAFEQATHHRRPPQFLPTLPLTTR